MVGRRRIPTRCFVALAIVVAGAVALGIPAGAPGYAQAPDDAEPSAVATPAAIPSGARGLNPGFDSVGAVGGVATGALARLSGVTDAGVSGEATLLRSGSTTIMTVLLEGLAPDTVQVGAIRAGGCEGAVLHALESISVNSAGQGRGTTILPVPLDTSTWWVTYSAAERPTSPATACGPVVADR